MLSRLVVPSRAACVSGPALRNSRSLYYDVRRRWTPREYNEEEEGRKIMRAITDKDAILANMNKRHEDPENAVWPEYCRISKRAALIGKKLGCHRYWLRNGRSYSCTLVQLVDNIVMDADVLGPDKHTGLYIAAGNLTPEEVAKEPAWKLERFQARSIHPRRVVGFMRTSLDCLLPPKTVLTSSHFRVNQFVDVLGMSIDRGFQGVMKLHGFKGQPASHGVTKTHRRPGAIGNKKDGIWKGRRMAGHMGYRPRVAANLRIVRINHKFNVLYLHGRNTLGHAGDWIVIRDSAYHSPRDAVPHPTHIVQRDGELPEEEFWDEMIRPDEETLTFKGDGGKAEQQVVR